MQRYELTFGKADGRLIEASYNLLLKTNQLMPDRPDEVPLSDRENAVLIKSADAAKEFGNYQLTELNMLLNEAWSLLEIN